MNNTTVATGVNRGRRLRALVRGTALGLVSVVLGGGHCADAQVQAPADAKATFEVASVKPNKSGPGPMRIGFAPGGRFTATNVPLRDLIAIAYGEGRPLAPFQIAGGPGWVGGDRFDIVAKAEGDLQLQPGAGGPPPQLSAMLRALLEERFKLVIHRETKELPIYALVLSRGDAKLGPQLTKPSVDCEAMLKSVRGRGGQPPPPAPGQRSPCGMMMAPGNLMGGSMPLAQLAVTLSRFLDRMVVDKTGLTDRFDFELKWTPDQLPQGPPPPGAPPLPPIDPNGPSIFTAVQEQLGLKLESQRGPVPVVVIDHVEQPTED